jgi:hypothetical protein
LTDALTMCYGQGIRRFREKEAYMQKYPVRQVVFWIITISVIYSVISDPHGTENVIRSIVNGLSDAGQSLAHFISSL